MSDTAPTAQDFLALTAALAEAYAMIGALSARVAALETSAGTKRYITKRPGFELASPRGEWELGEWAGLRDRIRTAGSVVGPITGPRRPPTGRAPTKSVKIVTRNTTRSERS